jgi:polyphenol oxidase
MSLVAQSIALTPEWPVSPRVRAAFTLRSGGVSTAPYDTLNVGAHVGDDPACVRQNRTRVCALLQLPVEPAWLEQVHGNEVVEVCPDVGVGSGPADAVIVRTRGAVAAIQVADCLPVLFASSDGTAVAAAHAGWRGLAAGVLEATVSRLGSEPTQLLAWIGPGIGTAHFEVGDEVREAFVTQDQDAAPAFHPNRRGRWQCDLVLLARQRLIQVGLTRVFGGRWCTYSEQSRFFSFRRDGKCGRMAALIWLT